MRQVNKGAGMRTVELAKKLNLKENQAITWLSLPEWKPYFRVSFEEKLTPSLRKEISKRLWKYHRVRNPVKFKKIQGGFLGTVNNLIVEVNFYAYYKPSIEVTTKYPYSKETETVPDVWVPQEYYLPTINIREFNPTDYSDVAHPLHEWFELGAELGYGDGFWNRDPNEPLNDTPEFSSKEAEIAYRGGYERGFTNGVMDE
jgi:hypothetical protein